MVKRMYGLNRSEPYLMPVVYEKYLFLATPSHVKPFGFLFVLSCPDVDKILFTLHACLKHSIFYAEDTHHMT